MPLLTRRALLAHLSAIAGGISLAPLARAAPPSLPAPEAGKAALIKALERYLNGIQTLAADFMQVAPSGAISRGRIFISRPGLMRIEYQPPTPFLVVADGRWLIYYDKELEETSYTSLSGSLAGFLLRQRIAFSGDVAVAGIEREKGVVRLSLTRAEEPDAGRLTLVFATAPLELRQWSVRDPTGADTRIALLGPRYGMALDRRLFEFTPPKGREDPPQ